MFVAIIQWWLVVEVLGLIGLPWSVWLFRRLPDRGISFAKALGILLTGYLAWLAGSLGIGSFSTISIIVAALLVGGSGIWACRRMAIDLRAAIKEQRWWWAWQSGIFAAALLFGLLLRWHAPWGYTISHTEMNMDFMFTNGILASPAFPPQDPWLAGYPINYYYFGYLLVAMLTRLSGLPSAWTFTLALPTIFALTASGALGIVWNATGMLRREDATGPVDPAAEQAAVDGPSTTVARRPWGRLACATLAALLLLVMANQSAALMYTTGLPMAPSLDGSELTTAVRQSLAGDPAVNFTTPTPKVGDPAEWSSLTRVIRKPGRQVGDFFWWPSRSVWDTRRGTDGQASRQYTITEFPLFSFILGDMHPHVLSLPWTLLALALALNLLPRKRAPEFVHTPGGRIEAVLTAIILGSLYAINSWDLPTYLLLYGLALLLLYSWLAGTPRAIVWPHFITQAAAVVVLSFALWLPFYLTFTSLVSGNGFPLLRSPVHTGLAAFLSIFGLFFVPLLALLIRCAWRPLRVHVPATRPSVAFGIVSSAEEARQWTWSWPLATAALAAIGLLLGWPLLWLLPLAGWAFAEAFESRERTVSAALLLLAIGALVVWGTDVVFIRDVFNSRMNTIFKFFYQVWLIWGVAAAIAIWLLLRRLRPAALLWLVPFAILLIGGSFYLVLAPNWKPVEATLNGLANLNRDRPGDAQALRWIQTNTPGDAVILEAPGDGYNSPFGVVSMTTGRPTIIAWKGHEDQWRGGQPAILSQLATREQDATTIYTSPDREDVQPLLDKYKVDYVYVGTNEHDWVAQHGGSATSLSKFGEWMQKVYDANGVTIYHRQ